MQESCGWMHMLRRGSFPSPQSAPALAQSGRYRFSVSSPAQAMPRKGDFNNSSQVLAARKRLDKCFAVA